MGGHHFSERTKLMGMKWYEKGWFKLIVYLLEIAVAVPQVINYITKLGANLYSMLFCICISIMLILATNLFYSRKRHSRALDDAQQKTTALEESLKNHKEAFKYFPSLEWEYKFIYAEYSLEFKTRKSAICNRKFGIKAMTKGVRELRGEYAWTGDVVKSIKVLVNDGKDKISTIHYNSAVDKVFQLQDTFNIELVDPLEPNEEMDCNVFFDLRDNKIEMHPHIYTEIVRPTEKLLMRLKVPAQMVTNVNIYIKTKHGDKDILHQEALVGKDVPGGKKRYLEYAYMVPEEYRKFLYCYEIKWDFQK